MQIDVGDRIAQLVLFPYIKGKVAPGERTGDLGSTGKQRVF
jgi:dUTPase